MIGSECSSLAEACLLPCAIASHLLTKVNVCMVRPVEYDRDHALQNIMELFWRQGFNATSMPQLLESADLSRSSFYSAFGDKRQSFIESLNCYAQKVAKRLVVAETTDNAAEAIYFYYAHSLKHHVPERFRNGCLVINTILEFENIDNELYELAKSIAQRADETFYACFERAIASGTLNTQLSPAELVLFFSTFNGGISVKKRSGLSADELKLLVDVFIQSIGGEKISHYHFQSLTLN
jgi:TetR/AcrR family transcriptional repressor of nem operon